MISMLIGDNSFEAGRELQRLINDFDGTAEKVDGTELELKQLPDLLMGATLFAEKRLVIIKNLSENKPLWSVLPEWLPRVSEDVHLVLVDEKPDKRTKTYKDLQKAGTIKEFNAWGERDGAMAERWVSEEAGRLGFSLDKQCAHLLVARVGVDQWSLYRALQKLAVLDEITPELIEETIDANPVENVFNLFEAALKGDGPRVGKMIETLRLGEDAYRLLGLLSSQAFQLLAMGLTDKPQAEVAKDLGAHPFALSKLAPHAKRLGKPGVKKVFAAFVEADSAIKTSAGDPWVLIERALIKVTNI